MQSKKRIPVSENVAYTHWEMPDLTGVKRRIAQRLSELQEQEKSQIEEETIESTLPSQEEIDALKEQARQEGYASGFSEGRAAGQEEGRALGYQEGEKTGQEAGFQAGYQRGLDQAQQEVDQQLARLQSLIEQLQGPLAALDHEVESALLSLVDLVCRAILRREIKIDRSYLAEVLQEAVAALPAGHQRLRIFLNPEDLNLAEAACQDMMEDYRLVGDPEVTLGGVKIETLQSLVDSTLENRYKKIIEKLLGGVYQSAATNFEPLPEQVLSTPDSVPLNEAAFSEPKITKTQQPEEKIEKAGLEISADRAEEIAEDLVDIPTVPEPVAQVSLQRGKVPRHEQKLAPIPNPIEKTESAEPVFQEEAGLAEPESNEAISPADFAEAKAVTELSTNPEPEESSTDTPDKTDDKDLTDVLQSNEIMAEALPDEVAPESQEGNSEEVDDFLDEFTTDDAEAEFEALLAESANNLDINEGDAQDKPPVEEAAEAKDWAPESVHDDRYLEDVLENTWLDDLQEPENEESLVATPSVEKPGN